MNPLLCGVIPWFGGHPDNLRRTVDSMRPVCDEVLVVHQSLFDSDRDVARSIADKVEVTDWNCVFGPEGYGGLPNKHGQSQCEWMLLLGVGETIAGQYKPIREVLRNSPMNVVWRCDHLNDTNTWGRIWRPSSGVSWKGVIHEEAGGGSNGSVIFRMQDTDKEPHSDPFVNECLKWMKVTSYDHQYYRLGDSAQWQPEGSAGKVPLLGYTNRGWLTFCAGSKEARFDKQREWADLIGPGVSGDRESFYAAVRHRMENNDKPTGVNFAPTGQPMSAGA